MKVTIREVTAQDYGTLCAVIEQVDALHRTHLPDLFRAPDGPVREREYILSLLADDDVALFVAEVEGEIAGFINVYVQDARPIPILVPRRYAVVENVVVRESYRRAGIGRALMELAHEWAREQGATGIELGVYAFNEGAIAFYRELGYEILSHKMSFAL